MDSGTSICSYDYLVISNGAAITDRYCGDALLDLVFPFNGNNPLVLTVNLNPDVFFNRIWNIEASPIPC